MDKSRQSVALKYDLLQGMVHHIYWQYIPSDGIIPAQATIWLSKSYKQPKG